MPSLREGKIARVEQWLKGLRHQVGRLRHHDVLQRFRQRPALLEKVKTSLIAANPDDRLRHHAAAAGWRIMNLFWT